MLKALILLITMCFLLPSTQAAYENPAEAFDLSPEEQEPTAEDVLNRRKEKFQRDELMVYDIDKDIGFADRRRWTGDDRNRLAAAFHLNGQYEFLRELQSIEVSWLRRTNNWHKLWWGAMLKQTNGEYGAMADNNPNEGITRERSEKQSLTTFGAGVGYRLRLLTDFIETDKTMETVNVFATYNTLGSDRSEEYKGYGFTADYGLHRRTRSSFFWGGKFTYNLAWVERSQSNTPQTGRSLSLGYYTFAFEAGFYF